MFVPDKAGADSEVVAAVRKKSVLKVLYTLTAMAAVFLGKRNQPVALLERGAGGHCKNDQMRKPEPERVERVNNSMEAIMIVAVAVVMPGLVSNVALLPTRS